MPVDLNDPSLETNQALDIYREQFIAVQRFQNGDSEAALLMLDGFSEFLDGFFLLLRGKEIKRLTYSHRIFISNFIKYPYLGRALKTRYPSSAALRAGWEAMNSVSIQLRSIDDDDLKQEIAATFLTTLKRYRSRNDQNYLIPYILKSFPFALTRCVQKLIKDPLVNLQSDKIDSLDVTRSGRYLQNVDPIEYLTKGSASNLERLSLSYEQVLSSVEEDGLGNPWLQGEICNDKFDCLTYAERKILKFFYYLEMTDAEIALAMGISYNTAIRRRHHIESKLRGEYQAPTCQYCKIEIPKSSLGRQPRQCENCRRERRSKRRIIGA